MPRKTSVETCGEAVAPNCFMPQFAPWSLQPGVVAVLVPADHIQSGLPGGAMLVPAGQFHCQQLQAAVQPQMQGMQGPMHFSHMHQDGKTESQPFYIIDNNSYKHSCWRPDDAANNTTLGSYSKPDYSTDSTECELSPRRPQPTASAARRLRRKRAAESFTNQRTTAEASPYPRTDSPTSSDYDSPSALCSDAEMLGELQLKLSKGGRKDVEDALAAIRGHVWSLSCRSQDCSKLVQLALERANPQEASELVVELHGHVQEAIKSPHANHVIQKVVTQLTFNAASFVAEELAGSCAKLVRHCFGCRIFVRLLEFCSTQNLTSQLVDELLAEKEELCRHSFAHHVMQKVLEHGNPQHRKQVVAALISDLFAYAEHKNASYVVEDALLYSCQEDKQVLLAQLSHPAAIERLAMSQYGSYVVRALHQFEERDGGQALKQAVLYTVGRIKPELRGMKHGQSLLVDLGLEEQNAFEHGNTCS